MSLHLILNILGSHWRDFRRKETHSDLHFRKMVVVAVSSMNFRGKRERRGHETVSVGSKERGWWPGQGVTASAEKGTDLRCDLEVEPLGLGKGLDAKQFQKEGVSSDTRVWGFTNKESTEGYSGLHEV